MVKPMIGAARVYLGLELLLSFPENQAHRDTFKILGFREFKVLVGR